MRFHAVIHRLRALVTLIFIGGFGLVFIAPTVQAAPGSSDPAWQAADRNNVNLTGRPVLQRSESDLNYDWGAGSRSQCSGGSLWGPLDALRLF